jgi:hypothetical protein
MKDFTCAKVCGVCRVLMEDMYQELFIREEAT